MSEQKNPQGASPKPQSAAKDDVAKSIENALRLSPQQKTATISDAAAQPTQVQPETAVHKSQRPEEQTSSDPIQEQPTQSNSQSDVQIASSAQTERKSSPISTDAPHAAAAPTLKTYKNTKAQKSQPSNKDSQDIPPYQDPKGRSITPRHRRLALRQIRQMGLVAENGDDALTQLSKRGIDFLDQLESNETGTRKGGGKSSADPQKQQDSNAKKSSDQTDDADKLPVPKDNTDVARRNKKSVDEQLEARRQKVADIQRNLVKRRRKRLRALLLRLIVLVFIPTAIVSYYFWYVATDMYETNSAFVIQKSDSPGGGGGIGDLLAGTGFANSQDSIVVQDYLQSREAFDRLEQDHDFTNHFKNPEIDSVQRLTADASLDASYALYQKVITIGYDPTEGLIRMTVIASDPQTSQKFSEALVSYAEERVDGLTQEARGDQLADAERRYQVAEEKRLAAQQTVLQLQQQRGVLSADVELQLQMQIINQLELQAETQRLSLAELLDNPSPRQSNVEVLRREIDRLEKRISERRADLTEASEGNISLARVGAELMAAETELATRQLLEQESLSALEASRLEADRQVRYLSMAYSPVAPVEATYPKKFENTILAFLVFGGIYILLSLTVSILREQMSV